MEDSAKPDPQFIQSIQAGLRYWQAKTEALGPEQVQWLDDRRQNLHQAIQFGLTQPETWFDAAKLLLQAFDFSEWRGYWPEWIPVLEQALAMSPEKETLLYGSLLNRLGQLYRLAHRLPEAEIQHQAALELAQRLASDELLLHTYNSLAQFHLARKNIDQTRKYGRAALDLAKAMTGLARMEAFSRITLGQIEMYVGNWPEAINHYQQVGQVWRKLGNHIYLARSLYDLGTIYLHKNDVALAQQAYREAADILEPTNNFKDKARVYLNIGALYYREEKWTDAETTFLQVDSIALREQQEFDLLAVFYNNLGNVYLKMAQWDKALEDLVLAIEIFRQTNNNLDLGNSLGTLAAVYKQIGKKEEALRCYAEAVELLEAFPESQWAQKLLVDFVSQYDSLRKEG